MAYTGFSEGFARALAPSAPNRGILGIVVRAETAMCARATHHGKTVAGRHTHDGGARARARVRRACDARKAPTATLEID